MFENFFKNTIKPQKNLGGKLMLKMMNSGHDPMAKWGLSFLEIGKADEILDIGCGGGKNIENLLARTEGHVHGIDYSEASVEKSIEHNKKMIECGRAVVKQASVQTLPYEAEQFDVATAFETIYFWPDIAADFKEVFRVLKKGGRFLIVNEDCDPKKAERWTKMLKVMTVYTADDLKKLLSEAGFTNIRTEIHKNGRWIRAIAYKE